MKRFLSFLLIVFLVLMPVLSLAAAVTVNGREFSTEEVQRYLNATAINIRLTLGASVLEVYPDSREFLSDAAEHFVTVAIMDEHLKRLGLYDITPEEQQSLYLIAQQTYEQVWQRIYDLVSENGSGTVPNEKNITAIMETSGYSLDDIYQNALNELRQERLMEAFCSEITVTDEEALATYEETEVTPSRERYENNIPLFEQEVLLSGNPCAWIPDGYRYMKYILVRPPEALSDAVDAALLRCDEADIAVENAYQALAQAAIEGTDLNEMRETYLMSVSEQETAYTMLNAAKQAAETAYLPLKDEIVNLLDNGLSFEELISRYSEAPTATDPAAPGYPVHRDSVIWDPAIRDATMALERYGECSDPVWAGGAVYILCRMDNMRSGAYELSSGELDNYKAVLLYNRRLIRLNQLTEEWREDCDISIDLSHLVVPE